MLFNEEEKAVLKERFSNALKMRSIKICILSNFLFFLLLTIIFLETPNGYTINDFYLLPFVLLGSAIMVPTIYFFGYYDLEWIYILMILFIFLAYIGGFWYYSFHYLYPACP